MLPHPVLFRVSKFLLCRLLESHDLQTHDRRILQLLAAKKLDEWEKDSNAHTFRQKWAQEYLLWKRNKENQELLWQKELNAKRKREAEENESRLIDLRRELVQAQNNLKCLIHQKHLKYDQLGKLAINIFQFTKTPQGLSCFDSEQIFTDAYF